MICKINNILVIIKRRLQHTLKKGLLRPIRLCHYCIIEVNRKDIRNIENSIIKQSITHGPFPPDMLGHYCLNIYQYLKLYINPKLILPSKWHSSPIPIYPFPYNVLIQTHTPCPLLTHIILSYMFSLGASLPSGSWPLNVMSTYWNTFHKGWVFNYVSSINCHYLPAKYICEQIFSQMKMNVLFLP